MPKFSVKKPYTVFVAMIAILVLGIVAYTRMTPDLLPNLDLPYVVVVTTYPGATPEKVETEVTKPLEQTFATLDNLENIQSSSSENYCMIMMEFTDDVNMDTISVDILQSVDAVSGSWDDMVGTPYILKINPNMLPAAITAVGMEDMDTIELSTFVEEEILPELEGVEGIASVDAYGMIDTQVNVLINQEKIDEVNERVKAALDDKFAEAKEELDDGQAEIDRNKAKINSGKSQLSAGKTELADQLSAGAGQIASGTTQLIETKIPLQDKLTELNTKKTELETAKKNLTEVKTNIAQAKEAKSQLEIAIASLQQAKDGVAQLTAARAGLEQLLAAVQGVEGNTMLDDTAKATAIAGIMAAAGDPNLTSITSSAQIQAAIQQIDAQLAQIDAQLAAAGTDRASIDTAIATYQSQLDQVNAGLAQIDTALAAQNITADSIDSSLLEVENGLTQINAGIAQLENGLAQIEAGEMQLAEAQAMLTQQQTTMIFQLS
nr:efflux RND transporter permease subunit [Lachnospiraceae bacterium]